MLCGLLEGLVLGEGQGTRNLTVFPLFSQAEGPACLTLKDALSRHLLEVREVGAGGSAPQLEAVNKGDLPVLLLDGEELSGAKQNRVLNTTLLIPAHAHLLIPVSCTEHGRWSYASPVFTESGYVMSPQIRAKKVHSVSESLRQERGYRSDQSEVWAEIAQRNQEAGTFSPTGAMRDSFLAKENDLAEVTRLIPCLEGQKGLLVWIQGAVLGFDLLPSPGVYSQLHDKLLKSYAMDSLMRGNGGKGDARAASIVFLKEAMEVHEEIFTSVGLGHDHRLHGPRLAGSALSLDTQVAHLALFRMDGGEAVGPMAPLHRRRAYRVE